MREQQMDEKLETIEALLLEARASDRRWHMKKEVTVSHILSTMGMLGLIIAGWYSLQNAVASVEARTAHVSDARITAIEANVQSLQRQVTSSLVDIKVELRRINDRLDEHQVLHIEDNGQ